MATISTPRESTANVGPFQLGGQVPLETQVSNVSPSRLPAGLNAALAGMQRTDVEALMGQYVSQAQQNDPDTLAHFLNVLNSRKAKAEASVALKHRVMLDTKLTAPVHHRARIVVSFVSPLLMCLILAALMWFVALAGCAYWTDKFPIDMEAVKPFYSPYLGGASQLVPLYGSSSPQVNIANWTGFTQVQYDHKKYFPAYEWFLVWFSFLAIVYMIYVTLTRATLWQHACAMFFTTIVTSCMISHLWYLYYLMSWTTNLVQNKGALVAIELIFAGFLGMTAMLCLSIYYMCADIDHDQALDIATKQLQDQVNNAVNVERPSRPTSPFQGGIGV